MSIPSDSSRVTLGDRARDPEANRFIVVVQGRMARIPAAPKHPIVYSVFNLFTFPDASVEAIRDDVKLNVAPIKGKRLEDHPTFILFEPDTQEVLGTFRLSRDGTSYRSLDRMTIEQAKNIIELARIPKGFWAHRFHQPGSASEAEAIARYTEFCALREEDRINGDGCYTDNGSLPEEESGVTNLTGQEQEGGADMTMLVSGISQQELDASNALHRARCEADQAALSDDGHSVTNSRRSSLPNASRS